MLVGLQMILENIWEVRIFHMVSVKQLTFVMLKFGSGWVLLEVLSHAN